MGNVTKSQQNNITSPNGNSLAVFVDGITGVMKVKDVLGNIQPLSDFVSGGGGGCSPFEYNANGNGIQPILGTNDANGCYSTIGGGYCNTASGFRSTIGGGGTNNASSYFATVGGGYNNIASGNCSTILGGCCNTASCYFATVGGGYNNTASNSYTTVGGGFVNTASSNFATVGGGCFNTASCNFATVGGGFCNTALNYSATVGGGCCNIGWGIYSTVSGGRRNTACSNNGTIGGGFFNTTLGEYATISGGRNNSASGYNSTISGGRQNQVFGNCATVGGGYCNTASCLFTTVGGGCCNIASSSFSSILGGTGNNTCGFFNSHIIGSNLCSTQCDTTFTNCLSADNLTVGCAVSVGVNKVLINSPFTNGGGLFAQTTDSTPITATTVEGSLIDGGVGTLSVPANGFAIGDSFTANMSGIMSAKNGDTLTIRVKSGSVILAQSNALILPNITNQVWNLILGFTIRTLGGVGVASISTFGELHVLKLASGTQEGFGFSTINNTTFDTTISNTLSITAQWSSNSALNSIYTQLFVLTKIF